MALNIPRTIFPPQNALEHDCFAAAQQAWAALNRSAAVAAILDHRRDRDEFSGLTSARRVELVRLAWLNPGTNQQHTEAA